MRNLLLMTAAAVALGAGGAHATTFTSRASDPIGDFVGAIHDADLDLTGLSVTFDDATQVFDISATLDGAINAANAGNYVLGVNTGTGVSHPFGGVGQPDVRFNQAFVLQKTGAINNGLISVALDSHGFDLRVPLSVLTSTGFAPEQFGFNIWSRGAGNALADFAPENRMLSAVPEPAAWAMMIMGFGLTGAVARRRRMRERPGVPA